MKLSWAHASCLTGEPASGCTYDSCADGQARSGGQLCACHGSPFVGALGNTCVPGNCRDDAECTAVSYCSPSISLGSCGQSILQGHYCRTTQDTCLDDTHCSDAFSVRAYSVISQRWACQRPVAICT